MSREQASANPFNRLLTVYEEDIMISTDEVVAFPMSLSPNPIKNMLSLDAEKIYYINV